MRTPRRWILAVLAGCTLPAAAEVVKATDNGFELSDKLSIAAAPARVYQALTEVGRWWNPEHTYSGKAANLSLAAKAGGCFCEKLAGGGSVQHMTVVMALPGKRLRLAGALGPLQGEGASGSLSWALEPKGGATEVALDYIVGGYSRRGWPAWAPDVDAVLGEQLARLKRYVETGKP